MINSSKLLKNRSKYKPAGSYSPSVLRVWTGVLIFFLVLSGVSAVNGQQITTLSGWTSVYHGSSASQQTSPYTIPEGTNSYRVLLVAVATERTSTGTRTVSISYGGRNLTLIKGDMTQNLYQHTALYMLSEQEIDAASGNSFVFTVSGGTTVVTDIFAAVFDNVDQQQTITDSESYYSTSVVSSFAYPTALAVNTSDMAVGIISSHRISSLWPASRTVTSYPQDWVLKTEETYGDFTYGVRNMLLERSSPSANTTDAASIIMSGSSYPSMTAVSLRPQPLALPEFRSLSSGSWNEAGTWQQQYSDGSWRSALTSPGIDGQEPIVAGAVSSSVRSSSRIHNITLPSGIQAGDLLLVFWSDGGDVSSTFDNFPSEDWTVLYEDNTTHHKELALYRIADGTEGSALTLTTSSNEKSAHNSYRIAAGTFTGFPVAGVMSAGNNTNPDPPLFTSGFGTVRTLWIAAAHISSDVTLSAGYPASYSDLIQVDNGSSAAVATARKYSVSSQEDPGAFSVLQGGSHYWGANTIAIHLTATNVTVRSGHSVTVAGHRATDNVNVNAGGQLIVNNGITLAVSAGSLMLNNGTLSLSSTAVISGGGNFTLADNSFIEIASPDGIAAGIIDTGNIRVSGTRTYSTSANYSYNATGDQLTGSGLPATVKSLTLSGSGTKTFTGSVVINGAADFQGVTASTANDITFNGTTVCGGSIFATAGTVTYTNNCNIISGTYINLTTGTGCTLCGDITVNGTLTGTPGGTYNIYGIPVITNVTSADPDGFYNLGDYININLTFSEPVMVTGLPFITLETGATDHNAGYYSGSGSSILTFRYQVQQGDESTDLDYASTLALNLNGATIMDLLNNSAYLTLPVPGEPWSLSWSKNISFDLAAPVAEQFFPADGSVSVGTSVNLTITYNEDIIAGSGIIALYTSAGSLIEQFDAGSSNRLAYSGNTLTIDPVNELLPGTSYYVLMAEGSVTDPAGNASSGISADTDWDFCTTARAFRSKTSGNWNQAATWQQQNSNGTWSDAVTAPGSGNVDPVIAGTASSSVNTASANHTVTLPSGIQSGDLLIVLWSDAATATNITNIPAGWNQLYNSVVSNYRRMALYKIADGTEGTSFQIVLSGSERSAHNSYRIGAGTYSGIPVAGAFATATSNRPNPAAFTSGFGAVRTLWLAVAHISSNVTFSAYPTGYSNGFYKNDGSSTAIGTARIFSTAVQEDPGTFSISSSRAWGANTIAVKGGSVSATVLAGHTVTVNANQTTDNITVNSNGVLQLNAGVSLSITDECSLVNYGTLIMGGTSVVTGAGNFSLGSNSSVQIASTAGITSGTAPSGNIQVTGSRSYSSSADYTYNGTAQAVGNGLPSTVKDLSFTGSGLKTLTSAGITVKGTFSTGGTASVNSASPITVKGDFSIGSGSSFNSGNYHYSIAGDFTNDGSFTAGSSTFTLNGNSAQLIAGTSSTSFSSLAVNNVHGITLENDISVENTLIFAGGLITTAENIVRMGASASVSGQNDARYVSGKIAWSFTQAATREYPLGKGGNYRPLTLGVESLTGPVTMVAEQFETALAGTMPDAIISRQNRYWSLVSEGSGSAEYYLTLSGEGFSCNESNIPVILHDDGTSVSRNLTSFTSPYYYTSRQKFTSPGSFTLAESGNCWLGNTSDWFSTSNWLSEEVPDGNGFICIPSSLAVYPVIAGSRPVNNVTISETGILEIKNGASVTLDSIPVLTIAQGAVVTTTGTGKIIIHSGASFINLGNSQPLLQAERRLAAKGKGWRMIASPVSAAYNSFFVSPLVTQGFSGSTFPLLQPNLLWFDETDGGTDLQSWRTPSSLSTEITAGRGHLYYIFDGASRPNTDGSASGQNYTDLLPLTISVTGIENQFSNGSFNYSLTSTPKTTEAGSKYTDVAGSGWNLIGNPTASTLNWEAATGWTKTNLDSPIYVWDEKANSGNGAYLYWTGNPLTSTLPDGLIAPFQGFWVHATGEGQPSLSFTNDVKTTASPMFTGKGSSLIEQTGKGEPSAAKNENIIISMIMQGLSMETTAFISLGSDGLTGPDNGDVYRLEPMSSDWLAMYMNSTVSHREPLLVNSLPFDTSETLIIPLYAKANSGGVSAGGSMTLSWNIPENWPEDMTIDLMDHEKQVAVSMLDKNEYKFILLPQVSVSKGTSTYEPLSLNGRTVVLTGEDQVSKGTVNSVKTPFSIVIRKGSKGSVSGYERLEPVMLPVAPNPFSDHTKISFRLPEENEVTIEAFDINGRLLETVANGLYPAGLNEIMWYPASQYKGMVIFRFRSGLTISNVKAIRTN